MESLIETLMGIVWVGIAGWCLVSVFVKRMRIKWRCTNRQAGLLSVVGLYLVGGCGGITMIFDSKQIPPLLALLILLGFLLAGIGSFVDTRPQH